MAIPESFLDELNTRVDIVDLVSSYVQLHKKGGRYWGCCPFHSEKTPSFSVSPDKQMYYCFGCHKGGGITQFIMEEEGVGFVDAVAILAKRAGLPMPDTNESRGSRERRERLFALNKEAARFFYRSLNSEQGAAGRAYFARRGLSRKTVTSFGLGYAPESWDALMQEMLQKGYTKQELQDVGLVSVNDKGRIYDRFRGRVMFPIIDVRGNVIGFGGRVLGDAKPKYLNSPDTVIYNKSRNLFALNIAKKSKAGRLILTEGYMDTIALHQAGFDYAVASLGTALTEEHARLIAKYTKEVILSYDGDEAGVKAAQRGIGILTKVGLSVKVLNIKGAKDPDEFIQKHGARAFERLLNGSENQIDYRLLQIQQKYDLQNDEQRVSYLQEAAELIAHLSSPVEREVYGGRAADAASIDRKTMLDEVESRRKRTGWKQKKQAEQKALQPTVELQPEERRFRYENVRSAKAEEGILCLVMCDNSLFERIEGLRAEMFSSPLLGHLYQVMLEQWEEGFDVRFDTLSASLSSEEISHLARILQQPMSWANHERALADCVNTVCLEHHKRQVGTQETDLLARIDSMKQQKKK